MKSARSLLGGALVVAVGLAATVPAAATTLIRQGLEKLVAENSTVVLGEVLKAQSYWNDEGTFILTDVRVRATEVLKGSAKEGTFTVTLLGGRVGDLTTLIVAGAELVPGKSYLLFLGEDDLPGVKAVRTVRDHSQGVFEIVRARDGYRAISQANRHPLQPDALGFVDPPGGAQGLLLEEMVRSIRDIETRQAGQKEVR